jgi:hypothetical protein
MSFESLTIPRTQNRINTATESSSYSTEILSKILKAVSLKKLLGQSSSSLASLESDMELVTSSTNIRFNSILYCNVCKTNRITIVTDCNHGYCKDCLVSCINKGPFCKNIQDPYLALKPQDLLGICPQCSEPFTLEDCGKVFENPAEVQMRARIILNESSIRSNNFFLCINCDKIRGSEMYCTKPCSHMCKLCISEKIRTYDPYCNICKNELDSYTAVKEQYKCSKVSCKSLKYLVGDCLQEICPNFLYCTDCLNEIINCGYCDCHDAMIPYGTKYEIYSRILKSCESCKRESYPLSLLFISCCKYFVCYNCGLDSKVCRKCSQPFTSKVKQKIDEFRKNSNRF